MLLVAQLLFALTLNAQLIMNLHTPPPGQFSPEDFTELVHFNNMFGGSVFVFMSATIEEADNGLIFAGNTGIFQVEQGFSSPHYSSFDPVEIEHFDADYEAYVIQTNNLPPGDYIVCVRVYDAETSAELAHECVTHSVFMPTAPEPVYPPHEAIISEPYPVFNWLPPAPPPQLDFFYTFKLVEVYDGQSPYEAIQSNPAFYIDHEVYSNAFPYPAYGAALENGGSYAWQVQAMISGGIPIGENNGTSDVSSFQLASMEEAPFHVWVVPEGEFESWSDVEVCFTQLNEPDITYEIYFSGKDCDTTEMDQSHPFAGAVHDPDHRAKLFGLFRKLVQDSIYLKSYARYCDSVQQANIDSFRKALKENQDRLRELENLAEALKGEINFDLPDDCDYTDPCCDGKPCCEGLDPCEQDDRKVFFDRLSCLNQNLITLNSNANTHTARMARMLSHWRNGANHRAVMDFYDSWFSLADGLFEVFFEALDWLTTEAIFDSHMEKVITKIIQESLVAGVCVMDQEWCDKINAAQDAYGKLKSIKDLMKSAKASGKMPPKFILKMMQAMYQQAGAATGVAVQAWDESARELADELIKAYQSRLCLQMALEQQLAGMEDCEDFCKQIEDCIRESIVQTQKEIDKLRSDREEARKAALDKFKDLENNELKNALNEMPRSLIDKCCNGTPFSLGDQSECAALLEAWLRDQIGDDICYINIEGFKCVVQNNSMSWEYESIYIRNNRRPECCEPLVPFRELIGEKDDYKPGDDDQCYPETEQQRNDFDRRMGERGRGEIEVIARRPNGQEAARGGAQAGPRPGGQSVVPDPPLVCDCKVEVLMNGTPTPSGATYRNILSGTAYEIIASSSCDPCPPGTVTITKQFTPFPWQTGLAALPPVVSTNDSLTGNYNLPGIYSFMVSLLCEDGATCTIDFRVIVFEDIPADLPEDIEIVNPPSGCGNHYCLTFMIAEVNTRQFKTDIFNWVKLDRAGLHDLKLESTCTLSCPDDKNIIWDITEPDGNKVVYEGIKLYEITHNFDKKGDYYICVEEQAYCNNQNVIASKYLIISL